MIFANRKLRKFVVDETFVKIYNIIINTRLIKCILHFIKRVLKFLIFIFNFGNVEKVIFPQTQ